MRLRAGLREYFPTALDAFDDLAALDTLELLGKEPDPASAARLTRAQITAALHRARRRGVDAKAAAIRTALRTPALTQPAPVTAAFAAFTRCLTAVIGALNAEIAALQAQLAAQFDEHPETGATAASPAWARSSPPGCWRSSATIQIPTFFFITIFTDFLTGLAVLTFALTRITNSRP